MSDFGIALKNTLILNGLDLLFGFPVPIILAILLNEMRTPMLKKFSQTMLYLPHFLSWVIIGGMVLQILRRRRASSTPRFCAGAGFPRTFLS